MIQVKSPTMGIQHIKRDQEEPEIFRFHHKITKTPSTTCYVSERRPLFTLSTLFYDIFLGLTKTQSLLYYTLTWMSECHRQTPTVPPMTIFLFYKIKFFSPESFLKITNQFFSTHFIPSVKKATQKIECCWILYQFFSHLPFHF